MKTRKPYTRNQVREKDFKLVKALLGAGLSNKKIAEVSGRSLTTISHINRHNSYKNYRAAVQARSEAIRLQKENKKKSTLVEVPPVKLDNPPSLYNSRIDDKLTKIFTKLETINQKLDSIEESLR